MGPISTEPRPPSTPTGDPHCDEKTLVCGAAPPPDPPPAPAPSCDHGDGWHAPMLPPDHDYACLAKNMASKRAPAPPKPPPKPATTKQAESKRASANPSDGKLVDAEPVACTTDASPTDAKPADPPPDDSTDGLQFAKGDARIEKNGDLHAEGTLVQTPGGAAKWGTGSADVQVTGFTGHVSSAELELHAGEHLTWTQRGPNVSGTVGLLHDQQGNIKFGVAGDASIGGGEITARSHYGSATVGVSEGAAAEATGRIEKHGDHVEMCGRVGGGPLGPVTLDACIPDVPATILDRLIHHKG